ncbi:hypothetical protein OsI_28649 [Oryza sativa Indica Group]|uniref:Uncharacterized protein n=2 Tax=Oryza sativa subsp. indica TaxID=39946 RepID=B8B997_ORYSI|nr:hypothetical protein OsI_28649 [Oryza sativa Indica Group]
MAELSEMFHGPSGRFAFASHRPLLPTLLYSATMAESIVSGLLITASAVARPHSSHSLPHGSCATRVPQLQRDRLCVRATVDEDEAMSIDNLRLFRRQRRQVEWSLLRALAFLFLCS